MTVCINTAYVYITSLRIYQDTRDRSTGMDEPRYCALVFPVGQGQRPSTLPHPARMTTTTTSISMRRAMNSRSVSRMPRAAVLRGLTSSAVIGATIKRDVAQQRRSRQLQNCDDSQFFSFFTLGALFHHQFVSPSLITPSSFSSYSLCTWVCSFDLFNRAER